MSEDLNTNSLKLYSLKSIWIATCLGGPLVFGYMMWKNCISFNQRKKGNIFLIASIVFTICLFSLLVFLPEPIVDKIPNYLITFINAGIAYAIVSQTHGEILIKHKEDENQFYSGWNVAGASLVSVVSICIMVICLVFIFPENEAYDVEMEKFSKNETETLIFYDHLETQSQSYLLKELETIILKWEENREILKNADDIQNLPKELKEQNKLLKEYTELRIKTFEVFKKAIEEDTDKYTTELDELHLQLDKKLDELE